MIRELADSIRSGATTKEQAVDTLVEKMLSSPMAVGLAPDARTRLEAVLRQQIAEDPALTTLVADLGRGITAGR